VYSPLLSPYVLHALLISFVLFDHPNNIWWAIQILELLFV
jgi:hypothetical protein